MQVNRRQFLRRSICAALGGVSLYSTLGTLRLMAAAAGVARPYGFDDYKALVCVFLQGGNDSFNTIVPMSGPAQADYLAARGALAVTEGLHALTPVAGAGPANYGLHPALPELAALFNGGDAALVANVGSLLYPVTQAEYQDQTVPVPAQLFSHDDQTTQWQTSRPDDANANGWGGRIADLLHAANPGQIPMSITLGGNNRFQRGVIVSPYSMDPAGVTRLSYSDDGPEAWVIGADNSDGAAAYNALIAPGTQAHVLERAYADAATRSITNYRIIEDALGEPPIWATPFPDTDLGNQLQMVARMIGARSALGMNRQVFFVAASNYDTHSGQLEDQDYNLRELSQALKAFHDANVQLGVGDDVAAFTASDFGRSLAVNGDGTDHGWGGHHFVVGGGVNGQRFYGAMPSLAPEGNPDDTGYGQIIPTRAVDQYAATLARWFGVDDGGIADIFPNLGRFDTPDLGFMG
ncbi:MAG TPA: DUF1501 domain-containing protein [Rhodanobacteraceae bacterium]|nr:DUF1501 domain-containing protein [Rhodanobacteraceae bacterium]